MTDMKFQRARRTIAAALMGAMAAVAIAAACLLPHDSPACHPGPQALPWLMMQTAGCPEARP